MELRQRWTIGKEGNNVGVARCELDFMAGQVGRDAMPSGDDRFAACLEPKFDRAESLNGQLATLHLHLSYSADLEMEKRYEETGMMLNTPISTDLSGLSMSQPSSPNPKPT